jgi:hypothetical protein
MFACVLDCYVCASSPGPSPYCRCLAPRSLSAPSLTIPRPADYTLGMENVDATANSSVWQSDTISSSPFDNVAAQFNSLRGSQGRCEGLDTNYIPEGLRKAIKFRISYLSTYYWPTKAVSGLVNLLVHNLSKASALRDPRSVLSTTPNRVGMAPTTTSCGWRNGGPA